MGMDGGWITEVIAEVRKNGVEHLRIQRCGGGIVKINRTVQGSTNLQAQVNILCKPDAMSNKSMARDDLLDVGDDLVGQVFCGSKSIRL